jgi:hypothetical protein
MKSRTAAVVLVLAALAGGLAFSQDPPEKVPPGQDPSASRIEKLELDLSASRLRIEALAAEVADAKKQVADAVLYMEKQAKAAAAMMDVLDRAERAGFTYGINPDSRHLLLAGWRDQLATAQKDLPELPPPPPPEPAVGKRVRKP